MADMMRAILKDKSGGPDVLQIQDVPKPEPSADEILVEVKYAGVNYADILSRKGLYSWAPDSPYIMGLEAGGEVVAKGDNVDEVDIGDRVVYGGQSGGYAQYLTVHRDYILRAPDQYNFKEIAAFGVNFFTAWVAIHEMARARRGETLLVHSAAGGVGTAAIQLGVVHDMPVYGTSSQPHKRKRVEELGATAAFGYDTFAEELRSRNINPDCVIETVGGEVFKQSFELLAPMGRIVLVGASGIKINKWNPLSWFRAWRALPRAKMSQVLRRSRGFMGVHLGYLLADPQTLRPAWARMLEVVEEHDLRPEIREDHIFPMSKAGEAHEFIDNRKNIGKVLLDPSL